MFFHECGRWIKGKGLDMTEIIMFPVNIANVCWQLALIIPHIKVIM